MNTKEIIGKKSILLLNIVEKITFALLKVVRQQCVGEVGKHLENAIGFELRLM